jgi:hypothetical protein
VAVPRTVAGSVYSRGVDRSELDFRLRAVPAAVFVDLLRQADGPLDARALKRRLEDLGVPKATVDAAWRRAQPGVRRHANVVVDETRHAYGWSAATAAAAVFSPRAALDELIKPRVPVTAKVQAADVVQAALRERDEQQARQRDVVATAIRALAQLAMEVEELATAGTDTPTLVARVREVVRDHRLTPIGRAGERVEFDPARHTSTGAELVRGASVTVVRPGYLWRDGDVEVMLAKARVGPARGKGFLLRKW